MRTSEVVEVRVVDDLETLVKFHRILVVTLRLFAELEERFLDLDIGKSVNLRQLIDADIRELMFPCDVSEAIDDPSSLMVSPICV